MSNLTSDELNFLGTFATIDAVYSKYPSGGVSGNFVTVNGETLYWNEDQLRWMSAGSGVNPASQSVDGDLNVGGDLNVNGDGHFGGDVTIEGVLNVSQINLTDPLPEPKDGQSIFKSIVFKRSDSRPADLQDTDGTFFNPVPTAKGWSDGIPSGTAPIWAACRVFTNDNEPPQGHWSRPELMADTEGFDVEFSDSVTKPSSPNGTNQHNGGGTQVWYDPYLDSAYIANHEMIWMATRTRVVTSGGPTWSPWSITRCKGENGNDGSGSETAYLVHSKYITPIIYNRNGDVPMTIGYTWQKTTNGLTIPVGSALWMSSRNYQNNVYGQWGDAVRISGDGAPGADGGDIEFIYKQMNRLPSSSDIKPTNIVSQDDYVPEADGWYDEAKGVDAEHKCEWCCIRYKHAGESVWSDWVGPFAWSVYGDRGMDGSSVQFVFKRTTEEEGVPSRPVVDSEGYVNSQGEYIPNGWTDDPQGTNSYYTKEWVSVRRKGEQQTEWSQFSDPAPWSYYSETHSIEIKNGYWWVDGHNTGIRAEGEDGKGINLKGVRDFYSTSDTGYTSGKTTLQELTGMEVGDCYVVNGGDHAGYIYTYNGGTATGAGWVNNWTELGAFRGTPGVSSFVHIAYAYNIDFDQTTGEVIDQTTTIYTDYEDIPIAINGYPDWVGICVTDSDENPSGTDPSTASSYEWNHTRGRDGSDYERVYIRTKQMEIKPTISSVPTSSATYQTNDYCPNCGNPNGSGSCEAEPTTYSEGIQQVVTYVFTDNPKGPDREWPYEWMAERKKVDGVWQAFGTPALWATFSAPPTIAISNGYWTINGVSTGVKAQGEDGQGIEIKGSFPSKAALITGVSNPSVGDCYYVTGGDDMGHLFFWDGTQWQDMGEIKGEPGQSQYLHFAWATDVQFSGNTATNVVGFTQSNAIGASYDWIGIYASDRPTPPSVTSATNDAGKLLYKWNYIKGMDGDQYEYVYIRTTENSSPGVQNNYSSGYKDSNNHAPSDNEFLPKTTESTPREYTDDPHGTDSENQFEWECYRRKNGDAWGAWYGPYLVHNWAKDGEGQLWIDFNVKQVDVECDSNGIITENVPVTINAKLYYGKTACTLRTGTDMIGAPYCYFTCNAGVPSNQQGRKIPTFSESNTKASISYDFSTGLSLPVSSITIHLEGTCDGVTYSATTYISVRPVKQGATGMSGPALRFRGDWTATTQYTYNGTFRDCVRHNSEYWMLNTAKNGETTTAPSNTSGNPWTSMGNQGFIATDLILADNGAINLLSSNVINLFNDNNNLVAKINGDGEGSYCIYYPGTTKKWYEMIPGWQIYYDNDANNTELWRLGKTGVIMRPTLGVWTDISLAAVTQSDLNSFDGSTVFTRTTYRQYIADSGEYNGKIFTSEPSNHDPSSTANILPDGMYTPNEKPRKTASIDKGDGYDGYTLTVYNISGGFIVNPREVERVTATEQG